MSALRCTVCRGDLSHEEEIVEVDDYAWHDQCFVCVQCFREFPDDVFFEHEGRHYCEEDFLTLFGPKCSSCGESIVGKFVLGSGGLKYHPDHFVCNLCQCSLASRDYTRRDGVPICNTCAVQPMTVDTRTICSECRKEIVSPSDLLQYNNLTVHAHHKLCTICNEKLDSTGKHFEGRFYCAKDFHYAGVPICGACRKPIEEGRSVSALGKKFHPEHFMCAKCEKPFSGARFYVHKGQAFCRLHYQQVAGEMCFVCSHSASGDLVRTMNKCWCEQHFTCGFCGLLMRDMGMKFKEVDQRPICKKCYGKMPKLINKRLKMYDELEEKRNKHEIE